MASRTTDLDESRAPLTWDDRARAIEVYVSRGLTEAELMAGYRVRMCSRCHSGAAAEPAPVCAMCAGELAELER